MKVTILEGEACEFVDLVDVPKLPAVDAIVEDSTGRSYRVRTVVPFEIGTETAGVVHVERVAR